MSSYGDDAGNNFASCMKSVKLLLQQNVPAAAYFKQQQTTFFIISGNQRLD